MCGFTSFDGDVYYLQPDLVKECPIGPIGETRNGEAFPDLSGLCALGHFIPDDFFILMTAFMDRGSVTYKNPAYFFFRRKKNI